MRLLSRKTVAARLDISVKTLLRMVDAGEFPAPTHRIPGQSGERWMSEIVEMHVSGYVIRDRVNSKNTPDNPGQPRTN